MDVKTFFREQFGEQPRRIAQAPGRLELLGNHTDYNEGLVMSVAVDRYIHIASTPRNDGQIELASTAFPGHEKFPSNVFEKNPSAPWANYVKGVLHFLRKRGVNFSGFNAAIHGTIPVGAGMSSSAALEVATALTVRQLYPYSITDTGLREPPRRDSKGNLPDIETEERMALAKLCQTAESQFVGVNVGLLDQISSLFGRASHVIEIDCQTNSVNHSPMPAGIAVVVCDSGVKHELSAGDYNELRRMCESAARALGVRSLRAVDPGMLERDRAKLSQREYECAYHIAGENRRVVFGERALREDDIRQFGQYLFQSHASSRDYFKNSVPELDTLVDFASAQPGCVGARLTGGGFGGATINLVQHDQVKVFAAAMSESYERQTGRKLDPLICRIVDGAA